MKVILNATNISKGRVEGSVALNVRICQPNERGPGKASEELMGS